MTESPTDSRQESGENPHFSNLIAQLSTRYREFELPAIFLAEKLTKMETPVSLDELGVVARTAFFSAHEGKGLNQEDPKFSEASFRNVALHAIADIQHRTIDLFKEGENSPGYMLLVSDTDVRWQPWRDGIMDFIGEKKGTNS